MINPNGGYWTIKAKFPVSQQYYISKYLISCQHHNMSTSPVYRFHKFVAQQTLHTFSPPRSCYRSSRSPSLKTILLPFHPSHRAYITETRNSVAWRHTNPLFVGLNSRIFHLELYQIINHHQIKVCHLDLTLENVVLSLFICISNPFNLLFIKISRWNDLNLINVFLY